MTAIGTLRERKLAPRMAATAEAYAGQAADGAARIQLELWNREWKRMQSECPYWSAGVRAGRWPAEFRCWEEFEEKLPVTRRADVQEHGEAMRCHSRPGELTRMTGGTTAEPVQMPAWRSEMAALHDNLWLGRGWYGIRPSSRLFLLWGHSHLLGKGWKGWVNARKREAQDRLLGYFRSSAYEMSDGAMRVAGEALLRHRPDYVLGYSVALDRFAQANADRSEEFRALRMKAVVGAAEAFPFPESAGRIERVFGAPVAMEYGSVETNLLAHTHPEGGYRVFWRTLVVEVAAGGSERGAVRVTSLYPRCFPLVRYELGDEAECAERARGGLGALRLSRVSGRCNEYVELRDGTVVHSEAFTHAVRGRKEVRGYQVVQEGCKITLRLLAPGGVTDTAESEIRRMLRVTNEGLGGVSIVAVADLERTVAGKTRMVIRRGEA